MKIVKKILLIDDSFDEFFLFSKLLNISRFDVKVTHATTVVAAIDYLERGETDDLIILDLDLGPGLTGVEFLNIRAGAKWSHIPVIVSSGFGDLKNITKALEAGAQDYLIKDISIRKMIKDMDKLGLCLQRELNS